MSEINEQFYTEILEQNKDAVRQAVADAMLDSIKREFQWELPNALKKVVNEFIEEEIAPSVRAQLLENKDELVQAATALIAGVPAEIGKALQMHLAKTLTDSWKLRKVTEALFQ